MGDKLLGLRTSIKEKNYQGVCVCVCVRVEIFSKLNI